MCSGPVHLTTTSAVGAGSAVLQYQGEPLRPPPPTVTIKPQERDSGSTVKAKDSKGATTYWWLATLAKLEGLLGASGPAPTASATVDKMTPQSSLTVAAATTIHFTSPKLSGTSVIPSTVPTGNQKATVSLAANSSGLQIRVGERAPVGQIVKWSIGRSSRGLDRHDDPFGAGVLPDRDDSLLWPTGVTGRTRGCQEGHRHLSELVILGERLRFRPACTGSHHAGQHLSS